MNPPQRKWRAALAFFALLSAGAAAGPRPDGFLVRESYLLPAGAVQTGNLIALDSSVTLAEGSTVTGNVVLIGGSLGAAGRIDGDVASVGAAVRLAGTASVGGDIAAVGPAPAVESGAAVGGSIQSAGFGPSEGGAPPRPAPAGTDSGRTNGWYELTVILFREFLLCAVAVLILLVFPTAAERVARTIAVKPAVSFVIGLLTMTAAAALFVLLTLTVCLSPLSLLGSLVLLVAALLGWVSMGLWIGRAVCGLFRLRAHPAAVAGIGTLLLTLAASLLVFVPFAGTILVLMAAAFGLGAVILTRFGGPTYQILPPEKTAPPAS
jgi:hypothetical protein